MALLRQTSIYGVGAAQTMGSKMKNATGWNAGENGTNTSGFSALPGGYRFYSDGLFAGQNSSLVTCGLQQNMMLTEDGTADLTETTMPFTRPPQTREQVKPSGALKTSKYVLP